jgi:hypothetical protein
VGAFALAPQSAAGACAAATVVYGRVVSDCDEI